MPKIAVVALAATAALVAAITTLSPNHPATYRLAIAADRTTAAHTALFTTTVELVGFGASLTPLTVSGEVDFDRQTTTAKSGLSPLDAVRLLRATDSSALIDLGSETVDGIVTHHSRASLPLTGSQSSAVDAWVDRSGLLRQMQLVVTTTEVATKITMRLRDFGHVNAPTAKA